jgi:hypothetical protein
MAVKIGGERQQRAHEQEEIERKLKQLEHAALIELEKTAEFRAQEDQRLGLFTPEQVIEEALGTASVDKVALPPCCLTLTATGNECALHASAGWKRAHCTATHDSRPCSGLFCSTHSCALHPLLSPSRRAFSFLLLAPPIPYVGCNT